MAMQRWKGFVVALLGAALLGACSSQVAPQDQVAEISIAALESVMEYEEELNQDMKYIAIQLAEDKPLSEEDWKQIETYFAATYEVEVLQESYEQLMEAERYDAETGILDGVLLEINMIDILENSAVYEGRKFRSSDGAVGVKGVVQFQDKEWKLKESKKTWES